MSTPKAVIVAVREMLAGRSREHALTGSSIARCVSLVVGRNVSPRRVGEAVEVLRRDGLPICSTSSEGYWTARSASEIEDSLRETERRARATLRQRRMLKRALAEFYGQTRIAEGV